jgi:hypothetical protein
MLGLRAMVTKESANAVNLLALDKYDHGGLVAVCYG